MKAHAIDVDKLKREGDLSSLWYQYDGGDLYILIGKSHVEYFEFTKENQHLEGGRDRSLKFGQVVESTVDEPAQFYKRSRIVEYQNETDKDLLRWAQRFMYECPNVENPLKEGIMDYLEQLGEKNDLLTLSEGEYESYRHPKVPTKPEFGWKDHKGKLKVILIVTFILWPIILFVQQRRVVQNKNLKKQCEAGKQASCRKINDAKMMTMDTSVTKPLGAKSSDLKSLVKRCLLENDCAFDLIQKRIREHENSSFESATQKNKMNKELKEVNESLCFEKEQLWACQNLTTKYLDPNLQEKILSKCSEGFIASLCKKMIANIETKKNRRECLLTGKESESCVKYYRQVISLGKISKYEAEIQDQCDLARPEFCFEIGKHYYSDKLNLAFPSRKAKAMENWKKACFEMAGPKSCYYFSVNAGKSIDFKEQKKRKKILKNCLAGKEDRCRQLRSIAEGYL
jgi:hypothetical protein